MCSKHESISLLLLTSVPHPFRFVLRKGWDDIEYRVYIDSAYASDVRAAAAFAEDHLQFAPPMLGERDQLPLDLRGKVA